VSVFERACVRAEVGLRYSEGFNPRPRLSLPLPKSVGMEVDADIACIGIVESGEEVDTERMAAAIGGELPEGMEVVAVELRNGKAAASAESATYLFPLGAEQRGEDLDSRVSELLGRESIELDRRVDEAGRTRRVEVRRFLKSAEAGDEGLVVECLTGPEGSIRVEEIEKLLGLEGSLAGPVRRTKVEWKCN
jgi:radical SAM-linked protein